MGTLARCTYGGIGFSAEQVAVLIDSVLQDRELFRHADHPAGIDLVTSGPEAPGINAWLARKLVEHFKKMAETGQFRRALSNDGPPVVRIMGSTSGIGCVEFDNQTYKLRISMGINHAK